MAANEQINRLAGGFTSFARTAHNPATTRELPGHAMFLVSDEEIASIMTAFEQGGEFAAMLEARRLWPALSLVQARDCVRTIATWKPRASGELLDAKKATP